MATQWTARTMLAGFLYSMQTLELTSLALSPSCSKTLNKFFVQGDLINSGNFGQRQKNAEVVRSTIESISHIDAYYTLFNDFISRNISLLDTYNNGIFAHTWRGILSFENKVKWFRRGFTIPFCPKRIYVDCEKVLECAVETLSTDLFTIEGLDVTFKNEAGRKISSQLGPQQILLLVILVYQVVDLLSFYRV